ncbi:centromere protein H (CENP-H)-domain-containing protein [Bombardia bombarda]|uniref:Centromere protein H (CENP-H)-domain-containing protein n=1 Tax=Bombardia bombarda TaxID=252184 RepID=A0AA39X6D3_9PEZI|nr:centromere protein H (CENP-H)-domain-containing protein [Bombardia bombarda]
MPKSLRLSEPEERALELYDSLQKLQLELALLRAQQAYASDTSSTIVKSSLQDMQLSLLEARATLALQNNVVESAMMVQPILEAVHNGTNASPVERDLSPLIQERDITALRAAQESADLHDARIRLAELEAESLRATRRNVLLASELLRLTESTRTSDPTETMDDAYLRAEMNAMEVSLRNSRQRWKVMKETAGAVVVGSGFDWVEDERLRDIVLDPPELNH